MNVSYFARNGNGAFFSPRVLADIKNIRLIVESMVDLTSCDGKMEKMRVEMQQINSKI